MTPSFSVSGPLASGMVLQRNRPIRFLGAAPPGESVRIRLGRETCEVHADTGSRWQAELAARDSDGPMELAFSCGRESRCFEDVWIGDVWLCSGQSNVAWNLHRLPEPQRSRHRELLCGGEIRLGCVPVRSFAEKDGSMDCDDWRKTGFDNVPVLPASLSVLLNRTGGIKVGIVSAAIGGSPVSTWIPQREFPRDPILKEYLETYPADPDDYEALHARWKVERAAFDYANEERAARGEPFVPPSKEVFWGPPGTRANNYPGGAFESMARPVLDMPLTGVLWYQGETDAEFPVGYADRLKLLVNSWRRQSHNPELAFVVVQLPSIEGLETAPNWPYIREAQQQACDSLALAHLVPTLDIGDPKNIHPPEKWDFAERMAPVIKAILDKGDPPQPTRITGFKQTRSGIQIAVSGPCALQAAAAIDIRRGDGAWTALPIDRVESETLMLRLPFEERVTDIRHAWKAAPATVLRDSLGWPVLPYRSDSDPPPRPGEPMH